MSAAIDRRRVLSAGAGWLAGVTALAGMPAGVAGIDPEKGVTAPEDLMKEHGVLNRCLLLYEEALRRLDRREEVPPAIFNHTAELIRVFVEGYHEKNEEAFLFPEFRKAGKLVELVDTLKAQHDAGRRLTAEILRRSEDAAYRRPESRPRIAALCRDFIRMYRPHEAREDTVLFPALRTLLAPSQVEALGDRMEEEERKILGAEGFEKTLEKVATLERQLGIYDLSSFTPRS